MSVSVLFFVYVYVCVYVCVHCSQLLTHSRLVWFRIVWNSCCFSLHMLPSKQC